MKLTAWLSGHKTYIVATLAIVFASYQLYTAAIDVNSWGSMVLGALGLAGLRSGMTSTIVQAAGTIIAAHPNANLAIPVGTGKVATAILQNALAVKLGPPADNSGMSVSKSLGLAFLAVLLFSFTLAACQNGPQLPPAPKSVSQTLFEAETGLDVAVKQATAYATLPRCGGTGTTPVCSDGSLVAKMLADARTAQDYLLKARQAENTYLLITNPSSADTAKVQAAVDLLTSALGAFKGEIPSTGG